MNKLREFIGRFLIVIIIGATYHPVWSGPYEDYIEVYSRLAVAEMEMFGIPASITLAQGLLESGAGRSTLAREGNNHFGIKCHRDWEGKSMLRNDDAPNECFRVYDSPGDSFRDHSIFLGRKRYESLYELATTDYEGWAKGLKRCGYATDPNYADRLITIIETYGLSAYDNPGDPRAEDTADYIHSILANSHPVRRTRGLHYVIARPGEKYSDIAKELKINKKKLLEYNDVESDGEIKPWEEVYLQPKLDRGPEDELYATIGDGECLHSIAQRFGMKISVLMRLNPGAKDEPGVRLRLKKGDKEL